ncbi:hypothetical protein MAR_029798 [Mya arenaria]|uniref:Uncharacterized protein n=1 Tax=Mya arenaria TaxID=6604 RepID=A0ABY7DM26_MYAAR|nr:hypothetical protein MAR_029798 [Mya arenaria]
MGVFKVSQITSPLFQGKGKLWWISFVYHTMAIIDQEGLHGLLAVRSRVPDRCILSVNNEMNYSAPKYGTSTVTKISREARFNLRRIPSDFMDNKNVKNALLPLIIQIETPERHKKMLTIYIKT